MQILCPFFELQSHEIGEKHIFEDYLREREIKIFYCHCFFYCNGMEENTNVILDCLSALSPLSNAQLAHQHVWNFKVQKKRQKEDLKG